MASPILNECVNPTCPFSGKPVEPDSLTLYRDRTVGFCNPDCRDKFADDPDDYPDAKKILDGFIDELEKQEAEAEAEEEDAKDADDADGAKEDAD